MIRRLDSFLAVAAASRRVFWPCASLTSCLDSSRQINELALGLFIMSDVLHLSQYEGIGPILYLSSDSQWRGSRDHKGRDV